MDVRRAHVRSASHLTRYVLTQAKVDERALDEALVAEGSAHGALGCEGSCSDMII